MNVKHNYIYVKKYGEVLTCEVTLCLCASHPLRQHLMLTILSMLDKETKKEYEKKNQKVE